MMPAEGGSFTNHPGIVDFKGNTYLFYHNGALPGGGGFNRSVCVQPLTFNADGSISSMKMDKQGIRKSLSPLNPYQKTEAETIAWSEGMKSFQSPQVGVFLTALRDDAFVKVREVDFGKEGASRFIARLGTTHNEKILMEVRLDSKDGQLLTTMRVPRTGGSDRWRLVEAEVQKVTGVHDVYFVFKGRVPKDLAYFDYWRFVK